VRTQKLKTGSDITLYPVMGDVNDALSFWRVREALNMSFSFSRRGEGI